MAKQFTVSITNRQRFTMFLFVKHVVKPANREEDRKLDGVWNTFEFQEFQDKLDELKEGDKAITAKDFSNDARNFDIGSVDLNTALGYLDMPKPNVDFSRALLPISDELQRAKEHKPRLVEDKESV